MPCACVCELKKPPGESRGEQGRCRASSSAKQSWQLGLVRDAARDLANGRRTHDALDAEPCGKSCCPFISTGILCVHASELLSA